MATVRAAVDSVFLRITKEEPDRLLHTVPALSDALWSNVDRRLFRAQLRALHSKLRAPNARSAQNLLRSRPSPPTVERIPR